MDYASLPAHMGRYCVVVALVVGVALETSAQTPPPTARVIQVDPLVAVVDADPLELARVAARLGDGAVLQRMDTKQSIELRLAAIRAAPFMRAPEAALPVLARCIAQRDMVLAQDAARSLHAIVRQLDVDALRRHEVLRADLKQSVTLIEAALAIEHLRADLRALTSASLAMLSALAAAL